MAFPFGFCANCRVRLVPSTAPDSEERESGKMEQQRVSVPRRLLSEKERMLRRERIFGRLREGWAYGDIAQAESLSSKRISQIVSKTLQARAVDCAKDHAMLQLARLEPALNSPLARSQRATSGRSRPISSFSIGSTVTRGPWRPSTSTTTRRAKDCSPRWTASSPASTPKRRGRPRRRRREWTRPGCRRTALAAGRRT